MCVEENKPLPVASLNSGENTGEIVYSPSVDLLKYNPWSSASLTSQTHVLYHLAARHGVDAINDRFIKALDELPPHSHQLVVILNIDDVFAGGSLFARKTFEKNARENSGRVTFLLDTGSHIKKTWCLKDKSSTIILLGQNGYVIKAKDGALNEIEVEEYTQEIWRRIP